MAEDAYTPEQIAAITAYVDVVAPPVGATAHFIFGTNQVVPADIVADRYQKDVAPLIVATGGVNRHNGVVEGRELRRLLVEKGVSESSIRIEDRSVNTRQNVEFALSHLQEAVNSGLAVTAVCKWYHLRAIHYLRSFAPDVERIYAVTYDPIYSGVPVTRENWAGHRDGKRRVIREWQEVSRRIADGSFSVLYRTDGAW